VKRVRNRKGGRAMKSGMSVVYISEVGERKDNERNFCLEGDQERY
jgi:hypothetical protein